MFKYISKFEDNPYRNVEFSFVKHLLIECGSISFESKLNWFIQKCFNSAVYSYEKTDVFTWLERLSDAVERASLLNDIIINANIDSFMDDLDDITNYLIDRAND